MAKGRVITGYANPYVAIYTNNAGAVTYSQGMPLGRGVSVEVSIEVSEEVKFYADNTVAETAGGNFVSGEATFGIDGLHDETAALICGLEAAERIEVDGQQVQIYKYGDSANPPYVGVGYIISYQEDGVETYVPTVLRKTKFATPGTSATTKGESIEFQSGELTATIMRDDTPNHDWKWQAAAQTTLERADAVLRQVLNVLVPVAQPTAQTEQAGA